MSGKGLWGRLPVLPTLVVLLAVGVMVALGMWQLQRLAWKEGLLAHYAQAQSMSSDVAWPTSPADYEKVLYRHSSVDCAAVSGMSAVAGRSMRGASGWAHIAHCRTAAGGAADVALGWSREPGDPAWTGGPVDGIIGPAGEGVKLVAVPAEAGLEELAAPDPADIPNNHLAYAVQWFLFALTALVIYALALRKKWRAES